MHRIEPITNLPEPAVCKWAAILGDKGYRLKLMDTWLNLLNQSAEAAGNRFDKCGFIIKECPAGLPTYYLWQALWLNPTTRIILKPWLQTTTTVWSIIL